MTVKTVKSSGGDYTTLQAAINACPADITATGTNETWEIECYSSASTYENITINGKTTDSTHYIRIYAAAGNRHNGITGGIAIDSNFYNSGILITNDNVIIEGFRFTVGTNGNGPIQIDGAATRNVTIGECVFEGNPPYGGIRITTVTGGTIKIRNCVSKSPGERIVYASSGSGYSVYAYNCTGYTTDSTADGNKLYWNAASVTCVAKNCLAVTGGGSNTFNGTWSSSSYNNSSDASAPGTNATTSWTHNFTDAANGNFNLTSEVAGTNLSADGTLPVTTDITGATRSGWSRGAFEYAPAAGGSGIPKTTKLTLLGVG